jgi:hypothetical protein
MKLFLTGVAVGFILMACLHHMSPAQAQVRNHYLDLGDKYLKDSDRAFGCPCTQAMAIQALAAYTAAQAEK